MFSTRNENCVKHDEIRAEILAGRFVLTLHVVERAQERVFDLGDIQEGEFRQMIMDSEACQSSSNWFMWNRLDERGNWLMTEWHFWAKISAIGIWMEFRIVRHEGVIKFVTCFPKENHDRDESLEKIHLLETRRYAVVDELKAMMKPFPNDMVHWEKASWEPEVSAHGHVVIHCDNPVRRAGYVHFAQAVKDRQPFAPGSLNVKANIATTVADYAFGEGRAARQVEELRNK